MLPSVVVWTPSFNFSSRLDLKKSWSVMCAATPQHSRFASRNSIRCCFGDVKSRSSVQGWMRGQCKALWCTVKLLLSVIRPPSIYYSPCCSARKEQTFKNTKKVWKTCHFHTLWLLKEKNKISWSLKHKKTWNATPPKIIQTQNREISLGISEMVTPQEPVELSEALFSVI